MAGKLTDLTPLAAAPSATDILEMLHGGTNVSIAVNWLALGIAQANSATFTVGNNVDTDFVLTHNLNTERLNVVVRAAAAPKAQAFGLDNEIVDLNNVKVKFASIPPSGAWIVDVIRTR